MASYGSKDENDDLNSTLFGPLFSPICDTEESVFEKMHACTPFVIAESKKKLNFSRLQSFDIPMGND